MDTKRPSGNESAEVRESDRRSLVSRRGFARAGLSSSVLLGSLASKPVLGASVGCTVSGQMSGNLSREALTFDCRVGDNRTDWLLASSWPAPFSKGGFPSGQCNFNTTTKLRGTNFNGYSPGGGVPQLIGAFYNSSSGAPPTCSVVALTSPPTTPNAATMLQVLNTTDTGDEFKLGRIVVVSLLNIAKFDLDYPVTYHTVIDMFNATFAGGSYLVGTVTWDRTRVIQYLESLVALDAG